MTINQSDSSQPGTVVVGLPLAQVDRLLIQLVGLEAVLTLLALVGSGLAARAVVARSLRPLNRVAATAQQVSQLELDRGEVALAVRVPPADANPVSEVGRVGQAFNHMLNNVEDALAARQASETKVRQFVADASHELRNPLAAIRGYAELTRRGRDELPADAAYAMSRVESEADRMSHLVDDLLLLARLDSGPDLEIGPTDLGELVVNAVNDARVAGPDHGWRLAVPEEPVTALADRHRLHQVVANLLANARTHTAAGTVVDQLGRRGRFRRGDHGDRRRARHFAGSPVPSVRTVHPGRCEQGASRGGGTGQEHRAWTGDRVGGGRGPSGHGRSGQPTGPDRVHYQVAARPGRQPFRARPGHAARSLSGKFKARKPSP